MKKEDKNKNEVKVKINEYNILYINLQIILTLTSIILLIISIFNSIGIEVVDVNLGSIADYAEFKNNTTERGLSVIVNIGYDITTVSLFTFIHSLVSLTRENFLCANAKFSFNFALSLGSILNT